MKAYEQVILTPDEQADVLKWLGTAPADHRSYALNQARIRKYVATNLTYDKDRSVRTQGNCLVIGQDVYVRKDGGVFSPEDLIALQDWEQGQVNTVKLLDPFTAEKYFLCDSSG